MTVTPWGTEHFHFDTLAAALGAAMAEPAWGKRYAEADRGDGKWSGGTYAECEKLARYGWKDGVKYASEKARAVVDRVLSTEGNALTMVLAADVVGACFDVGAYCGGVPECWVRPEPQLTKRAVHICSHPGALANVPPEVLLNRGIAVASLVLALTSTGYPVTVDIGATEMQRTSKSVYAQKDHKVSMVVRVADATTGSQLDVDRVVYALAHPTMLRLIIRAVTGKEGGWFWDYGSNERTTPPTDIPYDLFIPAVDSYNTATWKNIEAWVLQEYQRLTTAR